jgi:hypothetical protein
MELGGDNCLPGRWAICESENTMASVSSQPIPPELREQLEVWVEHLVDQRLIALFGDPDEGLELREEVIERLREQQKRVAAGERGRPMEEVFKELGID